MSKLGLGLAGIVLVILVLMVSALFAAPGELDSTFGEDGLMVADLPQFYGEHITRMALDSTGKIVIAGQSYDDYFLARYNVDGSLDTSFGPDDTGFVIVSMGLEQEFDGMALDSQERIILISSAESDESYIIVLRYTADGVPDTTFSEDGKVVTVISPDTNNFPHDVEIDSADRILVGGFSQNDQLLLRYLPDGTLDTSFSDDGMVITDINGDYDWIEAVGLQSDGRIIVVGGHGNNMMLARYLDNGTLDPALGGIGYVLTSIPDTPYSVFRDFTFDVQGKIIAVGTAGNDTISNGLFVRYTSDGNLDSSFGNGTGYVLQDLADLTGDTIASVHVDLEGRIITTGTSLFNSSGESAALIFRYNPDGVLDPSFDGDGIVVNIALEKFEYVGDSVLDANGNVVIGGGITNQYLVYQLMLARLEGGGVVVTPGPTTTPDPAITNFVTNGGFEDPDLSTWKVKNMPPHKLRKCNKPGKTPISYGGVCVFNFKGDGESTQIFQTLNLEAITFNPDEQLEFSAAFQSPKGPVIVETQLKIVYKNGDKEKVQKLLPLSISYKTFSQSIYAGNNDLKKIKIKIFNFNKRPMYVDEVKILRLTSTSDLIGLPLSLPTNP